MSSTPTLFLGSPELPLRSVAFPCKITQNPLFSVLDSTTINQSTTYSLFQSYLLGFHLDFLGHTLLYWDWPGNFDRGLTVELPSCNQPVFSNKCKVSCSKKQWEPLKGFKLKNDQLRYRRTNPLCHASQWME